MIIFRGNNCNNKTFSSSGFCCCQIRLVKIERTNKQIVFTKQSNGYAILFSYRKKLKERNISSCRSKLTSYIVMSATKQEMPQQEGCGGDSNNNNNNNNDGGGGGGGDSSSDNSVIMRPTPNTPNSNTNSNSNTHRSEERRVGKECRSRWSPYH